VQHLARSSSHTKSGFHHHFSVCFVSLSFNTYNTVHFIFITYKFPSFFIAFQTPLHVSLATNWVPSLISIATYCRICPDLDQSQSWVEIVLGSKSSGGFAFFETHTFIALCEVSISVSFSREGEGRFTETVARRVPRRAFGRFTCLIHLQVINHPHRPTTSHAYRDPSRRGQRFLCSSRRAHPMGCSWPHSSLSANTLIHERSSFKPSSSYSFHPTPPPLCWLRARLVVDTFPTVRDRPHEPSTRHTTSRNRARGWADGHSTVVYHESRRNQL
jgi:hypothetical protein